ncbi:MAG: lipoprotein [Gammaproteobacteria bacterium]|jgi:predicted small lipoprotein YifL
MYLRYLKLLALLLCLTGCGQTGPLYLPEKPAPSPADPAPRPADEPAQDSRD